MIDTVKNTDIKHILPARVSRKSAVVAPNVPPVRTYTEFELGWLTGVFEGEGSARGSKGMVATVSIPQKDPEILYRMRELLGGSISKVTVLAEGTDLRADTMLYTLNICGDGCRQFLQAIYAHLSTRRKMQIDNAGGIELTGRKQWGVKTTEERRALRLAMSEKQKAVESSASFRSRNKEAEREYQREYRKRNVEKMRQHYKNYVNENRDHVNALQRAAYAARREAKSFDGLIPAVMQ